MVAQQILVLFVWVRVLSGQLPKSRKSRDFFLLAPQIPFSFFYKNYAHNPILLCIFADH